MDAAEQANLTRFDGKRAGFYEVYFVEVQDAAHRCGLWVRYTLCSPTNPDDGPIAELWAMYFDREDSSRKLALKRTVPFESARVGTDGFHFAIGDAEITQTGCKGAIGDGDDRIEWDLSWGEDGTLVHFPYNAMYSGRFPRSKVVSPHFDLRASGEYSARGQTWSLRDVPGQQSHLWGTQHAHRWMWCHCNAFEGAEGAVFEGLTAQVKLGPIAVPPLTMFALRYGGVDYLFNRPVELLRTNESRTDAKNVARDYYPVSRWIVGGGNDDIRFRGEIWGDTEHFVGVRYRDPDGSELVCSHNKVACAKIEVMLPDKQGGWRVSDTLACDGAAALEFVGREADPRVPVLL